MITYTVKYKKFGRWKKLKKVKGDGILENNLVRWFMLEDETRLEIPINYKFKFSKERWYSIQERMSNEAGQDVKINKQ